ncbi:MAG: IPT/TIG domain-containing protein [Burkholderiaceae bacterium]|nr:IPT/TIG domain-containing protein [Burkholderiaceae bacterium]
MARGAPLTITGSDLNRATAVEFAGGATAAIASRNGSGAIAVTVPAAAASGTFTVIGDAGDRVPSASPLTVVAPISVDANATYRVAAGAPVTISGSGLTSVTAVTIGGSAATILSRNDTQLVVGVPAGLNCGPITLLANTQPAVPAGSVVVGAGCTLRIAGIKFAQVLSQRAGEVYQRLVLRRQTLVRAYVVAETAGSVAPPARLVASAGGTTLGTLPMSGPATVPQLAAGSPIPASLRYDETLTFNATLPNAWVTTGLQVRVEVDPEQRYGTTVTMNAQPVEGAQTTIDLVLVPLVSGPNVPTMPDPALAVDELVRRFPVARERVAVAMRQPYTVASTADGVDTSTEWSDVLRELEQLRRAEAPGKHYYGFVRPMVSAGTAGIGYVNSVNSTSPLLSSLGWDATRNWRRIMTHELGHNFSRPHAPCGSVSGADPGYPYAGGALSDAPLFESLLNDIQSPANQFDVMGYCNGSWFSDYNLREVQRFLEARPQPTTLFVENATEGEVLHLSGRIVAGAVRFGPVRRGRGAATAVSGGAYRVRLQMADGGVVELPVQTVAVDHVDPPEEHFFATLPAPGPLARVDLLRQGAVLPHAADSRAIARIQRAQATPSVPLQWQERGNALEISWDAAATPYLSVAHRVNGMRTVLALDRRGGRATVDIGALPPGGEYEFSLSDGLNAQLTVVAR